MPQDQRISIIGAGPAGLSAAYELCRYNIRPTMFEKDNVASGICHTIEYNGYRFDIGPHRFFTKNDEIMALWQSILGDEFLKRPRLTRIFYNGRFFLYPLKPANALRNLGLLETIRVLFDYARAKVRPVTPEDTFDAWVTNRFGRRLYEMFFKTYTEKVWGTPCEEVSAGWVAQRIKGLSISEVIKNALLPNRGKTVKTLIDEFHYPRLGASQMYEQLAENIRQQNVPILMEHEVKQLNWVKDGDRNRITRILCTTPSGEQVFETDYVISSMPYDLLVRSMQPTPPPNVVSAAKQLSYRSTLIANVIIDREKVFPDNWIYVHDSSVRVGRIQNAKNFSKDMVPDSTKTSLGMEYFVTVGDDLWEKSDEDIFRFASEELVKLGFIESPSEVVDGMVVRRPKTYTVHDNYYQDHVSVMREFTDSFVNLQPIGRYGLFKYNNMDHSILTGLLAARNIANNAQHDIWSVNIDAVYHEETR